MRRLLLAGTAMLGGALSMASIGNAQLVTQYPSTPQDGAAPLSAPSFGTDIQTWTGNEPVSPGQVTVRLSGRLTTYFAVGTDSTRHGGTVTTSAGTAPTGLNTKQAPYTVFEFARLYPSFDAMAANGLRYGAFLEIRQDNKQPAGGGVNGSIGSTTRSRGELYFQRERAYVGTNDVGFVQIGATDPPSSAFITGTMENFDDGGWNPTGDTAQFSTNSSPTWPFADQSANYATSKVVYLSPRFENLFDFGVSFEPNTGTVGYNQCNGVTAAPSAANGFVASGCDAASSTSVLGETARRRNTVDVAGRVRTSVGPVGFAGTVGYIGSTNVAYNGTPAASTVQYQGLSVLDLGAQVTYGGLAVGGHFTGGKINGAWSLSPQGAPNSIAWIGGASYAVGSFIVGASYFNYLSPGSQTERTPAVVGLRTEYGIVVGSTLTLAPGAYVFLSYMYGARHQNGVDLIANTVSNANSGLGYVKTNNNVMAQGMELGTQFRW